VVAPGAAVLAVASLRAACLAAARCLPRRCALMLIRLLVLLPPVAVICGDR